MRETERERDAAYVSFSVNTSKELERLGPAVPQVNRENDDEFTKLSKEQLVTRLKDPTANYL